MPTYVYECKTCEKTFEVDQRMSDATLTDCDCGAKGSLRRLIQPTAVMFKGSGFHINDYSGKNAAAAPAPACDVKEPGESCASCPSNPANN